MRCNSEADELDKHGGSQGLALVVDDDATNRTILEALLKKEGYQTISAADGAQAVQCFAEKQPDLVFMDVMMPVMDGYEAASRIKAQAGERFVPVIFLTGLTEDEALTKCIEAGGDDFLSKPYKQAMLRAKMTALGRIRDLSYTVVAQRHKIELQHNHLLREQEIAEHIYSRAVTANNVHLDHIRAWLKPASIFSGDLLLTAHHPAGDLHLLLGDFTGHGMTAAIGALPTSEVFHAMTAKGYSAPEILATINCKLQRLLPADMFMAACFVVVTRDLHTVYVWNAAMPDALVLDGTNATVKHRGTSQYLPLGILADGNYQLAPARFDITPGDHILLCSDGVIEARKPNGEHFGLARYEQAANSQDGFRAVVAALDEFCDDQALNDDISLVDIALRPELIKANDTAPRIPALSSQPYTEDRWHWSWVLHGASLRQVNPVRLAINQLLEFGYLGKHHQSLFTILTELYSNALEHGVLGLDSAMKASAEGFDQYYTERGTRLALLEEGWVRIEMECLPQSNNGKLLIRVKDSGNGFDYRRWKIQSEGKRGFSGYGIMLLHGLCESVHFTNTGNQAEVTYVWKTT